MKESEFCRNCVHWKPLFTGEAWGVRSFVDAPADEQARIRDRLSAVQDTDDAADFLQEECGLGYDESWSASSASNDNGGVPGSPDWPEWGECLRTEYGKEHAKGSRALAMDGSQYMAVLRCHADFGCNQFVQIVP